MALLRHEHEPVPQLVERRLAKVDAAEGHPALVRVVGAHEQLGEGRLAGAGRADERQLLARLDGQRDARDRRALVAVGESQVLGHDARRLGQRRRAAGDGDGRRRAASTIFASAARPDWNSLNQSPSRATGSKSEIR